MTEPADNNGAATAQPPPTVRSYGELVAADFKRNRLAMLASLLVFLVATVSVFCPLLANNRPLYFRALLTDVYDDSYFKVLDFARTATGAADGERRDAALQGLSSSFDEMRRGLESPRHARLAELRHQITNAAEAGQPAEEPLAAFEKEFDLAQVKLAVQERYPAVRALGRGEVVAISIYLFLVPMFFLRRHFRTIWSWLAAVLVPAAVLSIAWIAFFPTIQDSVLYRNLIEAPGFAESGGKAAYTFVPYGENENITAEAKQPPTWLLPENQRVPNQHYHVMGTDTNGRDVFARMIYGARISMLVGIVAVSIYVTIGIFLGALAGYFGGWTDLVLSRIIEIVICFPVLFLILSVQAFTRPSILNIMAALGLVWWTGVARLQRGEFLRIVNLDFVQAVRALGGSHLRIIFMHVLPNAFGPILVMISFGIAGSILVESALSFLGFGVPQPTASWGDLLLNGRADPQGTWWLTVFPGFAIFLTVTCFNLMGEGVRDALDPRRTT